MESKTWQRAALRLVSIDRLPSWSNIPSPALLDLGHIELQQAVKPVQQFLSVSRLVLGQSATFRNATERT